MGRYCGKCGREVQAVSYSGEGASSCPVYRCPHCGPNVPVVGSPVVEKEEEEEEAGYMVSESTVQAIQQVAMRSSSTRWRPGSRI
jgi:DNA-directed RNA polymerase subunit RPC12/RpoP